MANRSETVNVRSARRIVERQTAKIDQMIRDGVPAHRRRNADLDLAQAQKELDWALKQQETTHRLADEHDAERAKLAAERSARIKSEYLVEHPGISDDEYERVWEQVEAKHDENRADAIKPSLRPTYSRLF